MKISKTLELHAFLEAVDKAEGDVYLVSKNGDQYNLKSELSKYVAIGALINNHADDLELFCQFPQDEVFFLRFFDKYPETL